MKFRPIVLLSLIVSFLGLVCVYMNKLSISITIIDEEYGMNYPKKRIFSTTSTTETSFSTKASTTETSFSTITRTTETSFSTIKSTTEFFEEKQPNNIAGQIRVKIFLSKKIKQSKLGRTWEENLPNEDCNDVRFLTPSSKTNVYDRRIALASFPGSGNTWLRHLFHVTTGVWTGSVYYDKRLFHGGYTGEAMLCNDKSVFAIKAHTILHSNSAKCKFDKAILILRNPYRAVLSEFNRKMGKSHIGVAEKDSFSGPYWSKYATRKGNSFINTLKRWLEFCNMGPNKNKPTDSKCLIINYDDMVKDTFGSMRQILLYLNLPINRLNCLNSSNDEIVSGPFHRTHVATVNQSTNDNVISESPMCLLTPETRGLFYSVIKESARLVSGLKKGESYSYALSNDTPQC